MADREADWSRDVLERIVALLFALANLADLAADVPFLRRRQVLGILSHGEAEARAFVTGVAPGAPASTDPPGSAGDAACLAARLRLLALMLYAMLARRCAFSRTAGSRVSRPPHRISGAAVRRPGSRPPPASDTS
jgi:hypothetical protein